MRAYNKRTYYKETSYERRAVLARGIRGRDVGAGQCHLEHLSRCRGMEELECRHRVRQYRRSVRNRYMVHDEAARAGRASRKADRRPRERVLRGRNLRW